MNAWAFGGMVLAVVVGATLPLQALLNARLGHSTSGPLFASLVSFLVGTTVLLVAVLALRVRWPAPSELLALPGWIWFGGVIGAVYVLGATALVPRLGAASLVCLIVLGQLVGSLLLDHFGVLSSARPVDGARVLGGALVVVGALLVVKPWQAGA